MSYWSFPSSGEVGPDGRPLREGDICQGETPKFGFVDVTEPAYSRNDVAQAWEMVDPCDEFQVDLLAPGYWEYGPPTGTSTLNQRLPQDASSQRQSTPIKKSRRSGSCSHSQIQAQSNSTRNGAPRHSPPTSHSYQWSDTMATRSHFRNDNHPLPQLHDIPALHPGTGSIDGGDTTGTWGISGTHAYPLQDVGWGQRSEPHWIDAFSDDFGVTGTRMGAPQLPNCDGSVEAAGRCLSTYPSESDQPLNPLFMQNNTFSWIPLDHSRDSPSGLGSDTYNLDDQEAAPMLLEDPFSDIDDQIMPLVWENMQTSIHSQAYELDESSSNTFPLSPDPTLQISPPAPSSETHHSMVLFNPNQSQLTQLDLLLENGRGDMKTETGVESHPVGRRGPLPTDKALQIAKTRREKSVCIRCRMKKVACNGESPCERCVNISRITVFGQPCLKAHFVDIIKGGSCNYFSQRQIDHLTIDGQRRISKTLPEMFDFDRLLSLVGELRDKFSIGAFPKAGSNPLWILDLSQIFKFLRKLGQRLNLKGVMDFRKFLDSSLTDAVGWEKCVKDLDTQSDLLAVLHRWNSKPARVSFVLIPTHPSGFAKPLDVEDAAQEELLFLAAQLSRIVCRALEASAFENLQKSINKQEIYKRPQDAKGLVFQLGRVLLQFRWRIAWWEISGDGDIDDTLSKQRYIQRLKRLTMVLYFYYCSAKAKLPKYIAEPGLSGTQSFHSGAEPFFDNFPVENSIEGWEAWLEEGKNLVRRWARLEKVAVQVNPYPEHVVDAVV